jgi:hypothetical protein
MVYGLCSIYGVVERTGEIRGVFRSLVLYVSTVCESLELTELCDRMCVDFD